MPFYTPYQSGLIIVSHDATLTGNGTPLSPLSVVGGGGGGGGTVISATNSGDNQHYTLSQSVTSAFFYVMINNLSYTTDDTSFGFSASGTSLVFVAPLPNDVANTIIKLICL